MFVCVLSVVVQATQLVSALGHLSAGQSQQTALYASQKAIYSSPTSAYAWSCLAACVATRSKAPRGDPEAGGGNSDDARERQLGRETPMTDSLISMCYGKGTVGNAAMLVLFCL